MAADPEEAPKKLEAWWLKMNPLQRKSQRTQPPRCYELQAKFEALIEENGKQRT
jgi:hypothetical protein